MEYKVVMYVEEDYSATTHVYKKTVDIDSVEETLDKYYKSKGYNHIQSLDYVRELDKGEKVIGFTTYPQ